MVCSTSKENSTFHFITCRIYCSLCRPNLNIVTDNAGNCNQRSFLLKEQSLNPRNIPFWNAYFERAILGKTKHELSRNTIEHQLLDRVVQIANWSASNQLRFLIVNVIFEIFVYLFTVFPVSTYSAKYT